MRSVCSAQTGQLRQQRGQPARWKRLSCSSGRCPNSCPPSCRALAVSRVHDRQPGRGGSVLHVRDTAARGRQAARVKGVSTGLRIVRMADRHRLPHGHAVGCPVHRWGTRT